MCLAIGWSAVLALTAIESLRRDRPYLAHIEQMAREHHLIPSLGPSDTRANLQRP